MQTVLSIVRHDRRANPACLTPPPHSQAGQDYFDGSYGLDPAFITKPLEERLAACAIQITPGCLAYNRTFTVKPGLLGPTDGDRVPVVVKLYNSTHRQRLVDVPPGANAWRASQQRAAVTEEDIAEYAREMNIIAGPEMRHPNLLRVLLFSCIPRDWICCEMFESNLFTYVQEHRKSFPREWRPCQSLFTKVVSPIASAVEFLHHKKYVHKDVNSKHVLIMCNFSRVVLAGHKLTKHHDSEGMLSSAKRGEIHWMDPLCFEHAYAPVNDVYSLGVVLAEILTGDAPFRMENQGAVVKKLVAGESSHHIYDDTERRWPRLCQLFRRATDTTDQGRGRPDAKAFGKEVTQCAKQDDSEVPSATRQVEAEMHAAEGLEDKPGCVLS